MQVQITDPQRVGYNHPVAEFNYYHPIEVRYGDLDPQGHVNNARYLTYFEQARINYIAHLGLWTSDSFVDIGIILADAHLNFRKAVVFGQAVRVGVRVAHLGTKSLRMEYSLQDEADGTELVNGSTVLVTYDYRTSSTIPIPENWRATITAFEHLPAPA
jgi:acyl-CoA thioester hydrolase